MQRSSYWQHKLCSILVIVALFVIFGGLDILITVLFVVGVVKVSYLFGL